MYNLPGQSQQQEERDERGHGDGDPGDGQHPGPGGPRHRPHAALTRVSDGESILVFSLTLFWFQFSKPHPLVGGVSSLQPDPREEARVVQESAQDCQDPEAHKHQEQVQGKSWASQS